MDHPPVNTKIKTPKTEQEKVALEKLERLLSPEFRNYGIRYMNLNEYEQVLRTKRAPHSEISIFREDQIGTYAGLSFSEWLKSSAGRWYRRIHSDTDWGREGGANLGVEWYDAIVKILRIAKKQYHTESSNEQPSQSVRQNVMKIFRDNLTDYLLKEKKFESLDDPIRNSEYNLKKTEEALAEAKKALENLSNEGLDEKRRQRKEEYFKEQIIRLSNQEERMRQHAQVIKQFQENNNFLDDKEDLRKLAIALSDAAKFLSPTSKPANYHMAVVFSPNSIRDFSSKGIVDFKGGNWTRIKDKELSGDDIMGAVVLIPDKKLLEEVKAIDEKSGLLVHPLFDSHGLPRWPKM